MSVLATANRLLRNTGLSVVGSVVGRLASSVFFILISRSYGVEVSGTFSIALSYYYLGSRLSFWGLDHLLTREVARAPAELDRYLSNFLPLRAALGALSLSVVGLIILRSGYDGETKALILIVALSIWFESIGNLCQAVFVAFEELEYLALIAVVVGGGKLLLAILLRNSGILVLAGAFSASNLVGMLIGLWLALRRSRFALSHFDWRTSLVQLRIALPFFFIATFFILDNRTDVILLSALSPKYEIGLYSAAVAVIAALSMIPQGFRTSIYPLLARYQASSQTATLKLYTSASKYLFVFSLPVAVGVTVLAEDVIRVLYGPSFAEAAGLLQVAVWSFFTYSMTVLNSRMLIVHDQQRKLSLFLLGSSLVTIAANVLLVPRIGILGAAIAKVMSSVTLWLLGHRAVAAIAGPTNLWGSAWRAVVACVAMVQCVRISDPLGWSAQMLIGGIAYIIALLAVGGFSKEELSVWRAVVGHQLARLR